MENRRNLTPGITSRFEASWTIVRDRAVIVGIDFVWMSDRGCVRSSRKLRRGLLTGYPTFQEQSIVHERIGGPFP